MGLYGLTAAGPGERAPSIPWPALGDLAVLSRPTTSAASPGGQLVEVVPSIWGDGSRVQLGSSLLPGRAPHGMARAEGMWGESRGSLSLDATAERSTGAALARSPMPRGRLEMAALGAAGEGVASDALGLAQGQWWPGAGSQIQVTALGRRWSEGDQAVDRVAASAEVRKVGRLGLGLGVRGEHHGLAGGSSAIERGAAWLDGEFEQGQWLIVQGGARLDHERRAEEHRTSLAPQLLVALTDNRHDLALVLSAARESGQWMPEGVGVEVPATRSWQAEVAHRVWDVGELWAGVRRLDNEEGDLAAVGGLRLTGTPLATSLAVAASPRDRWSSASASATWTNCGSLVPRVGVVSVWRSGPGAVPPGGAEPLLPRADGPHLDGGLRLGQPIPMYPGTLVLEGTAWARLTDASPTDQALVPVFTVPAASLAARVEW